MHVFVFDGIVRPRLDMVGLSIAVLSSRLPGTYYSSILLGVYAAALAYGTALAMTRAKPNHVMSSASGEKARA